MIQFHDPRGAVIAADEPYELSFDLAASLARGETPTVGLLANGFPDSENFLRLIGQALEKQVQGVKTSVWNKGNAAIPAPDSMLEEIQAQCQVAIAAYGH